MVFFNTLYRQLAGIEWFFISYLLLRKKTILEFLGIQMVCLYAKHLWKQSTLTGVVGHFFVWNVKEILCYGLQVRRRLSTNLKAHNQTKTTTYTNWNNSKEHGIMQNCYWCFAEIFP